MFADLVRLLGQPVGPVQALPQPIRRNRYRTSGIFSFSRRRQQQEEVRHPKGVIYEAKGWWSGHMYDSLDFMHEWEGVVSFDERLLYNGLPEPLWPSVICLESKPLPYYPTKISIEADTPRPEAELCFDIIMECPTNVSVTKSIKIDGKRVYTVTDDQGKKQEFILEMAQGSEPTAEVYVENDGDGSINWRKTRVYTVTDRQGKKREFIATYDQGRRREFIVTDDPGKQREIVRKCYERFKERVFIVKEDQELLEALVPGSIVRVALVNVLDGKFEMSSRVVMSIELRGSERYPMAIVRENLLRQPGWQLENLLRQLGRLQLENLLRQPGRLENLLQPEALSSWHGFLETLPGHQQQQQQEEQQQLLQQLEQLEEEYRALWFVFKDAPKDVFANIVQFAFV